MSEDVSTMTSKLAEEIRELEEEDQKIVKAQRELGTETTKNLNALTVSEIRLQVENQIRLLVEERDKQLADTRDSAAGWLISALESASWATSLECIKAAMTKLELLRFHLSHQLEGEAKK